MKNILIYDISYRTLIRAKHLRIRFVKIDGFVRTYYETRYLTVSLWKKWYYLQQN